ncbi:class I SAM-dependent methyltransferase [Psychromicrobium xiongbiense]|uniref:class I SAM-dependent methyltransferase n=1 Tax=Psychromicrobium xiongbiense TaxID=3051184 RepID=UPI002557377F|nr:class I SAM-dependent methyltransferase [Psychromicrobium sp. YIM S02556]
MASSVSADNADSAFTGTLPDIYARLLVPLLFEDYAEDVARDAAMTFPARILETAAGTGVVTRAMAQVLPAARLTATDLNPGMIGAAAASGTASDAVIWEQADAQSLPFPDASFDVVVTAFGAMFFPDRIGAYREAHRVLAPGGRMVLSVWDRLPRNPLPEAISDALMELGFEEAAGFVHRVPFAYDDPRRIREELDAAGFHEVQIRTVAHLTRPSSARDAAIAHVQGTPTFNHVEAARRGSAADVSEAVAEFLSDRFGPDPIRAGMSALVVTATA